MFKPMMYLVLAVVGLALVGCYTKEADNIDHQGATLHSQIKCHGASHGYYGYELQGGQYGGFTAVGPWRRFDCDGESGDVDYAAFNGSDVRANGLWQGTLYNVRLAYRADNGDYGWYDASATNKGGNYTNFRTDVDTGDLPAGDAVLNNGASDSLSAKACYRTGHLTQPRKHDGRLPYSKGWIYCDRTSISISTACTVRIRFNDPNAPGGSRIFMSEFNNAQWCSTKSISEGEEIQGATAELRAVLNNRDRKWTNSGPICSIDRLTSDNRSRLYCLSKYGNAPAPIRK